MNQRIKSETYFFFKLASSFSDNSRIK